MTAQPLAPAALDVIDRYVADLARALGPRDRTTRDIVAEVRDGLLTATERQVAAGSPAVAAARSAVQQSGEVQRVAPGLRADAVATRSRDTALALLRTGPVAAAAWIAAVATSPASPWRLGAASPWRTVLPWLGLAVLSALGCSLLANTVSAHGQRAVRVAQVAAVAAAVSCMAADLAGVTLLAVWTVTTPDIVAWPVTAAVAVSGGRMFLAGRHVGRLWPLLPA